MYLDVNITYLFILTAVKACLLKAGVKRLKVVRIYIEHDEIGVMRRDGEGVGDVLPLGMLWLYDQKLCHDVVYMFVDLWN